MSKATLSDKRVRELVDEISSIVRKRFPETELQVYEGDDPKGIYIYAYADIEDTMEVVRLVSQRMAEIVEEEGIIVGLVPFSKVIQETSPSTREPKERLQQVFCDLRAEMSSGELRDAYYSIDVAVEDAFTIYLAEVCKLPYKGRRSYPELVKLMAQYGKLDVVREEDFKRFHEVRNAIKTTGAPPSFEMVYRYYRLAASVLNDLFGTALPLDGHPESGPITRRSRGVDPVEQHRRGMDRAAAYLETRFPGLRFNREKKLPIGDEGFRRFDLVSEDEQIIAEVKTHRHPRTYTPSGKVSNTYEACYLLEKALALHKLLILTDHAFCEYFKTVGTRRISKDIEIVDLSTASS